MKPFEIQSTALSIGGVTIDTSAQGKLVIPGVTRAGTHVAIEVEDTGDQTDTWGQFDPSQLTVIDGYQFAVLNGDVQAQVGWTAATYAVDSIDGEGFIDGISVITGGAGYTGEAVTYSQQMLVTDYSDPINNFNPGVWTWIPFAVRCGAGEIQSEFGGGGASTLDQLSDTDISNLQDGQALVWDNNNEVWTNQTISGGSGSSGIVQQEINYPWGASGDTKGTIAQAPWGTTYVCTQDYVAPEPRILQAVFDYPVGGSSEGIVGAAFDLTSQDNVDLSGYLDGRELWYSDWFVSVDEGENWIPLTGVGYHFTDTPPTISFAWASETAPQIGDRLFIKNLLPTTEIWRQIDTGRLSTDGQMMSTKQNLIGGEGTFVLGNNNIDLYAQSNKDHSFAEVWIHNDNTSTPSVDINVRAAAPDWSPIGIKSWSFKHDGSIDFPDGTTQTTAYTGQSSGGTAILPLPSWIDVIPGTHHLPSLNADYGWDSNGVWTVNATIGENQEGTSYPFRTSFDVNQDAPTIVTVDFVVSDAGADFGIGVFAAGTEPEWMWDGTTGNSGINRIGAQYNGLWPELHGISGGADNGGPEGFNLPGTGTYRARLTVLPVDPGVAMITLETLDTSDNVLNTISYQENNWFTTPYMIGFASDQDNGVTKTYFKNLSININSGTTIYTDTLTSYNSKLAAGANLLINGNDTLTLEDNGSVTFPDGTTQYTAYPAEPASSPTFIRSSTEIMTNGTQTGIEMQADPYSVIVLASSCAVVFGDPVAKIQAISGFGLTWHKRSEYTDPDSPIHQRSEIWYAVNDSNETLLDIISVIFDNTVDDQTTIVTSYSGCNLTGPWTASGPSYSNSKNGIHATVTMNVSEPNTTGVVFFAIPNYGNNGGEYLEDATIPGYATGWTDGAYAINGSGEFWQRSNLSYKQFATSQTNLPVVSSGDLTWNDPITSGLTVIADALVGSIGPLNRIGKNGHFVAVEDDGRLTLGDGSSILGRVKDEDVVFWANDTAEYVGLWYGGNFDLTQQGYGPVSSFTVGNSDNDDLYRGPGNGGNQNKIWNDGPQANLDLKDKNWHFDGITGDLTLPEESYNGSFTSISSNGSWDQWMIASVAGPDGTVYSIGGESPSNSSFIMAQTKDSILWRKTFEYIDVGDGSGYNSVLAVNIKFDTQHNMLYVGCYTGNSTGVISINPADGTMDSSWLPRVTTNNSGYVTQLSFTTDEQGVPIIAGRSSGGWIVHNNLAGVRGTDNNGNYIVQVSRPAISNFLNNTNRWTSLEFDLDGTGNWTNVQALDTYFGVPVSYVGTQGAGGVHTAAEGTVYSVGALVGSDGVGLDLDSSLWTDSTALAAVLGQTSGVQFTIVIGSLTPGVDQTVFTFSSVSDWNALGGTMYHMDGNWTLVSGTGNVTTANTDIMSISYGTAMTLNISSYTDNNGHRRWDYLEVQNWGTGYQAGDVLRIPGSLLGGTDSTPLLTGVALTAADYLNNDQRIFIDMDLYPELSTVVVGTTVNVAHPDFPGRTGYVKVVSQDDNARRWVFTVTTDTYVWNSNNSVTVDFINGNDLTFTLDQWNNRTNVLGVPSADSYRIVMNQSFTGNKTTFTSVDNVDYTVGDFVIVNDSSGSGNVWFKVVNPHSTITDMIQGGSSLRLDDMYDITITGALDTIPVFGGLGYLVSGAGGIVDGSQVVSFTVTPNGTYNIRKEEGQQAFIWSQNWAHTFGVSNNGEEFFDVAYDPVNDTVFTIGYFQENNQNSQCLVLAINNTDGTTKWQKFVGDGNLDNYGYASSIGVTPTGDVITVGTNDNGYAMITKLNGSSGAVIWQTVQTNQSNWNNQPTGAVDENGDVYFGNTYYNNNVNHYMLQLSKLNGSDGSVAWSRTINNVQDYWMYDMWDDFSQTITVGGGQVTWAGYVQDVNQNYQDGLTVSLPQDGTGMGTYDRWIYADDTDFTANVDNTSYLADPATPYTPTDVTTIELINPSFTFYDTGNSATNVRTNIGSGLPGIVFADGSEISQAGITRALHDKGNNETVLDFVHNGKFLYFYGNNGNSTVRVPQNADKALPIGFTVSIVMEDFNGNTVYVNTGNDTNNGLTINASGFYANIGNNNWWRCGNYDNNVGIYTLMKVDTNRWILSGPDVRDDS